MQNQLCGSVTVRRLVHEKHVRLTVSAVTMKDKSAFGSFPPSIAGAGAMAAIGRRAPATTEHQKSVNRLLLGKDGKDSMREDELSTPFHHGTYLQIYSNELAKDVTSLRGSVPTCGYSRHQRNNFNCLSNRNLAG